MLGHHNIVWSILLRLTWLQVLIIVKFFVKILNQIYLNYLGYELLRLAFDFYMNY